MLYCHNTQARGAQLHKITTEPTNILLQRAHADNSMIDVKNDSEYR